MAGDIGDRPLCGTRRRAGCATEHRAQGRGLKLRTPGAGDTGDDAPLPARTAVTTFAIFVTFVNFGKFGKFGTRENPGWVPRQVAWAIAGARSR